MDVSVAPGTKIKILFSRYTDVYKTLYAQYFPEFCESKSTGKSLW